MAMVSSADLSNSLFLRNQSAAHRAEMTRLVSGLSSGRVAASETDDNGSFRKISGLQRSLSRLGAQEVAVKEAAGLASMMQTALGAVQSTMEDVSANLLASGLEGRLSKVRLHTAEAAAGFSTVLARMNTTHAGRFVFSGVDSGTAPMAAPEDILAALGATVAGETTAAGVVAAVEAWFAPGGDYDSIAYKGGDPMSPIALSQGSSADLDVTGSSGPVRDVLKGLAIAALIEQDVLAGAPDQQVELARMSGETLVSATATVTDMRARVGRSEELIETVQSELSAETTALNTALSDIVTADPFEWATELHQVETQLEMLYALTARTADLKLTDYLR